MRESAKGLIGIYGIITAAGKWVAAEEAPDDLGKSYVQGAFSQGIYGVAAAGWEVTACRRKQRRDEKLVDPDQADKGTVE